MCRLTVYLARHALFEQTPTRRHRNSPSIHLRKVFAPGKPEQTGKRACEGVLDAVGSLCYVVSQRELLSMCRHVQGCLRDKSASVLCIYY